MVYRHPLSSIQHPLEDLGTCCKGFPSIELDGQNHSQTLLFHPLMICSFVNSFILCANFNLNDITFETFLGDKHSLRKKKHLLGGEKLPPFRGRKLSPQLSVRLVEANQWEFPPKERRLGLANRNGGIWLEKSLRDPIT